MQPMRKLIIGANWKSNGTIQSIRSLVQTVLNPAIIDYKNTEVVIAPMYIHLPIVKDILKSDFHLGAQNCSLTGPGAYTGEVAAEHLKDLGIPWVILGHSERRHIYGESDAVIAEKVKRAGALGLKTIICVGENLDERVAGTTTEVVSRQLDAIKYSLSDWNNVVIAYEPVWAIGTGKTATPEQAQEVHGSIRLWIGSNIGRLVANSTRVIYGGSVTDENCKELLVLDDIDGFLVGGASLKPAFKTILEICDNHKPGKTFT
ncbi:unnamed protein product [Blepharisma stoltei]|uniref:Triosephosphate isomerase n=1 Tax=Blepharisma stoltei TaxID=1481888 RepID=A0AAU9K836_9CILI|nr:unnamed protein product [Blepharisma stoltei]